MTVAVLHLSDTEYSLLDLMIPVYLMYGHMLL